MSAFLVISVIVFVPFEFTVLVNGWGLEFYKLRRRDCRVPVLRHRWVSVHGDIGGVFDRGVYRCGDHVRGLYGVIVGDSVWCHHRDVTALRDGDGNFGVHMLGERIHHVGHHGGHHVGGTL